MSPPAKTVYWGWYSTSTSLCWTFRVLDGRQLASLWMSLYFRSVFSRLSQSLCSTLYLNVIKYFNDSRHNRCQFVVITWSNLKFSFFYLKFQQQKSCFNRCRPSHTSFMLVFYSPQVIWYWNKATILKYLQVKFYIWFNCCLSLSKVNINGKLKTRLFK